jgi:hypothetical protein
MALREEIERRKREARTSQEMQATGKPGRLSVTTNLAESMAKEIVTIEMDMEDQDPAMTRSLLFGIDVNPTLKRFL